MPTTVAFAELRKVAYGLNLGFLQPHVERDGDGAEVVSRATVEKLLGESKSRWQQREFLERALGLFDDKVEAAPAWTAFAGEPKREAPSELDLQALAERRRARAGGARTSTPSSEASPEVAHAGEGAPRVEARAHEGPGRGDGASARPRSREEREADLIERHLAGGLSGLERDYLNHRYAGANDAWLRSHAARLRQRAAEVEWAESPRGPSPEQLREADILERAARGALTGEERQYVNRRYAGASLGWLARKARLLRGGLI